MVDKREKQIEKPGDKPQWIVAQRPLSSHTILGSIWFVLPGFGAPPLFDC